MLKIYDFSVAKFPVAPKWSGIFNSSAKSP